MLRKIPYEIIEHDVIITIKGINEPKIYKTKKVSMKVNLGENEYIIEALALPEIDICLNIPGLNEIVSAFVDKGYNLADAWLKSNTSDIIDKIDIILGSKSSFCIPETDVVFGKETKSIFAKLQLAFS